MMRQVCPLCVLDDYVTRIPLGDGAFEYTCSYSRRHRSGQSFTWIGTALERLSDAPDVEGPAQELGMLDHLPACLNDGEPWVEYGIVEDRYAKLNPEAFEELRRRYGHRLLGPRITSHTMSAYIARVLKMLSDRNVVALDWGKATGGWSYNEVVSYWAKPPPGPPKSQRLSYEVYRQKVN